MKKTIKVLLIFLIIGGAIFALTGCGVEKYDRDKVVEKKQDTVEEKQSEVEFSMGEWNDDVYSNAFLGLNFKLPEGWSYLNEEEIAQMMSLGTELLNDDQKAAAEIAKLTSVYYMVAQNESTGNNVNIFSEKQFTDITTKEYIDAVKTQLLAVQSMNYEVKEISKEKIGDIEMDTLTTTGLNSGVEITQKYYIYKIDKYIVGIIATSVNGEEGINEIIKCFE